MCSLQRTVFMALLLALVAMPVRGDVITISVADGNGADAFVDSSVPDAPQGVDNEFRMRVRSDNTQRKTYLRFDLSALAFSNIDSVTMSVFADEDDDVFPNFVHAFGINDGEFGDGLSDWAEDEITFDDAPEVGEIGTEVGENTTMLSSFELPEPPGGGRVPFSGGDEFEFESTPEFVEFIRADKNDLVTFILIYEESVGSSFAIESKEDGAFSPATLTISGSGVAGPALQPGDADHRISTSTSWTWCKFRSPPNTLPVSRPPGEKAIGTEHQAGKSVARRPGTLCLTSLTLSLHWARAPI